MKYQLTILNSETKEYSFNKKKNNNGNDKLSSESLF